MKDLKKLLERFASGRSKPIAPSQIKRRCDHDFFERFMRLSLAFVAREETYHFRSLGYYNAVTDSLFILFRDCAFSSVPCGYECSVLRSNCGEHLDPVIGFEVYGVSLFKNAGILLSLETFRLKDVMSITIGDKYEEYFDEYADVVESLVKAHQNLEVFLKHPAA